MLRLLMAHNLLHPQVLDLIALERLSGGVPPHRVIIGGFGAGAGAALYTALVCETRLAGVVALVAPLAHVHPANARAGPPHTAVMSASPSSAPHPPARGQAPIVAISALLADSACTLRGSARRPALSTRQSSF